MTKCKWAHSRIQLLGFVVGEGTRSVDEDKFTQLRNWPDPTSTGDIVSFRAFANYLREYIPDFPELDAGLKKYAKKGARFNDHANDTVAQQSFNSLRQALSKDARLHVPDFAAAAKERIRSTSLQRACFRLVV